MKFLTTILAFVLLGLSATPLTLAGALPKGMSIHSTLDLPHALGKMTFSGTLGGHQVELSGTVEEMNTQMKELHPDFDADALASSHAPTVTAREADNKSDFYCIPVPGQDWVWANAVRIQQGIDYLNNFQGLCGVPGATCVRISCSYNSAIYLCNDNSYGITPNCAYMASYATDIINRCSIFPPFSSALTGGQEFDTDGYNIIVREDSC